MLEKIHLWVSYVPPRYRSSYFGHIWNGGYAAEYYAYLWTQMLKDDAFDWFVEHGGISRANGDRFRDMVLSRGNSEDLAKLYEAWRGASPSIQPMLRSTGTGSAEQLKVAGLGCGRNHSLPAASRVLSSSVRS